MSISFRSKPSMPIRATGASRSGTAQTSPFVHGLDTMAISAGCLRHLKELGGHETASSTTPVYQNRQNLPTIYTRKGERQPLPASTQEAIQKTIESLKSTLEQDADFLSRPTRSFFDSPVARQLATAMILGDQDLQDQVAKTIWENWSNTNETAQRYPDQGIPTVELPDDYHDIDIPAMLRSQNQQTVSAVLFGFDEVMVRKARTTGLTDTERLLSTWYAQIDFASHATFDDKAQPILGQIEKEFQENGLEFDKNKSYSFSLDTSDFTFTVSGGTEQENALMEKVMNTTNIWGHSYDTDNVNKIINSLLYHRREDGSYNSWSIAVSHLNNEEKAQEIEKYGIGDAPQEYEAKMKQLRWAYQRYRLDQSMKRYYGIGVDDLEYKNGKIVGKTDEVNAIVEKGSYDFMKTKGCAYIELQKHYTGTPTFESPVFTLDGGKFHVEYTA